MLSAQDILSFRTFEDTVLKSPVFWEYGHLFDVPYRSLVPRGVRGLLVAGRCLSATRLASDATRIIATCVALGEAAGVAAGLAAKARRDVRDIDIRALQRRLREHGAELDLAFPPTIYSAEQNAAFEGWFEKLRKLYGYRDEW